MELTLSNHEGTAHLKELDDGRWQINVTPAPGQIVHDRTWTTSYPLELIKTIFEINGAAGLCFELRRDEDPEFVRKLLTNDIFAYFPQDEIDGRRILEVGCGGGASSKILAELFPNSEIVAIELIESALVVARKRAEVFGLRNLTFMQSPDGSSLPPDLGEFDFVVFSAVYEHLLPEERPVLLPKCWSHLKKDGYLFINQTPNIRFPVELHTTMLPLINYLPDSIALPLAHRYSKKTFPTDSWEDLLRKGIRGATESEILGHLVSSELLEPTRNGIRDRIDLYYANTNLSRLRLLKLIARFVLKALRTTTGIVMVPDLSLAIRKL